jgi:rubredoxin-NAD+ reductase
MRPLIIVGTGLAGYTLAREYRKREPNVPLVLLTRDDGGFYSKPSLSNAHKDGKSADQLLQTPVEKMAEQLNAVIHPHVAVSSIDTSTHTLVANGETLAWNKLVLATGADAIQLPLAGDAADQILSVNDRIDFAAFRHALLNRRRVVVLGAGLIGCEFANDLAPHGFDVTVLDLADRPLGRLLPADGAAVLRERLEHAGVKFRFGISVSRVDRITGGVRVTLDGGDTLDTDLVLSAVGLRPRTRLAAEAGLTTGRGIVTDRLLRTSHPDVHALGDSVEIDGWVLPFVLPLMAQARALAGTLTGTPTPVAYPAFPIVVKTPACKTVICPPPPDIHGQWQGRRLDDGWRGEYRSADGVLHGFALMGDTAIRERMSLVKQVPDWLPAA